MRYINLLFTYLLTYILNYLPYTTWHVFVLRLVATSLATDVMFLLLVAGVPDPWVFDMSIKLGIIRKYKVTQKLAHFLVRLNFMRFNFIK